MLKEAEVTVISGTDSRQRRADKRATTIKNIVRSALNPVIMYTYECRL